MRIGYACINMTLGQQKITTNRGMVKRTFDTKGVKYVSELVLQNVRDLLTIINWNHQHGINFYRMSSDMFPWMSEYQFDELPDISRISNILNGIGTIVSNNDHRLTFHPGPFNVLASPNQDVVTKTVAELNRHSQIMNMIGLPNTPFSKINIHVGGAYGNKSDALKRWVDNFHLLSDSTKSRLTIENDSKKNQYCVEDLMFIHEQTGVPIVFDYHHHFCYTGSHDYENDLKIAVSTWPNGITPVVHYSESALLNEGVDKTLDAHSFDINKLPNTYGHNLDIMVESKGKELSILKFL